MKKQHPCCHGEGDVENKPIISYLTPGQVMGAMKKSSSVKGLRVWDELPEKETLQQRFE